MTKVSSYRRIAVLDIGKTNAKVVVLESASAREIASLRISNTVLKDGPTRITTLNGSGHSCSTH
jgi:sugar (pentulose or hexulose) kinase